MSTRKRYWWNPDTKQIEELGARPEPEVRTQLMLDGHYAGLQATDGTPIDSRGKHRAYMAANGLAMAADYTEHLQAKRKERDAFYTEGGDWRMKKERREDIARAAHDLAQRKRR